MKILDFGIARAAEFAEEEAKKGLIKGKVSYLSPEQIYVRAFDARATSSRWASCSTRC